MRNEGRQTAQFGSFARRNRLREDDRRSGGNAFVPDPEQPPQPPGAAALLGRHPLPHIARRPANRDRAPPHAAGPAGLKPPFRWGMVRRRRWGASRGSMIRLTGLALAALAAFSLATPLKPGEWPQARSDMKADPDIRFGSLPNGMRYAILRNATPPGQASMRLRFDVGSLMELDDQQGLAHFLEHMAFNGSKNLPGRGEMVKTLERLGLAFGADTNAGTGFDNTTYKFDLPKADDASLDTALMLLREIGGNLTLDQGAMDQERGVILSEERLRDSPAYRVMKSRLGFTMEGQRPPERFPIGLVPVIQSAKTDL